MSQTPTRFNITKMNTNNKQRKMKDIIAFPIFSCFLFESFVCRVFGVFFCESFFVLFWDGEEEECGYFCSSFVICCVCVHTFFVFMIFLFRDLLWFVVFLSIYRHLLSSF